MEKINALGSEDIVANNIEKLKELFPNIFSEGKLVVEELQALLGDYVEKNKEFYQMTWAGKTQAKKEANKISTGTLRPNKADSKDWDTTGNIFIEGDNLEVLKLLQKTYSNKIKMIYIDPPYNTGKDFVYKDNYKDNLSNYLEITGQTDEEGKKLSTNTDSDGRYHSNWLNMMYPRLKLARNLMTDDGVIFISIDDNEQANLKRLCDEIFGEENFAGIFVWQARQSIQNDTDLSNSHEYIISYSKNRRKENRRLKESNLENWYNEKSFAFYPKPLDIEKFSNPDNDVRGVWKADPFDAPNLRPNLTYKITNPNTHESFMPPIGRCWRTTEIEYNKLFADNRIIFGKNGTSKPQLKVFYEEKKHLGSTIDTWLDGQKYGTATKGTKLLQKIFNGKSPFDTVKPIELISNLAAFSTRKSDYVLDFFAGSGTTAHAVMALNAEDCGNRKCISVQLPEPINVKSETSNGTYKNIADITKERIRRAGELVKQENKDKEEIEKLDVGFRAFKLDSSNIEAWDTTVDQFENQLDLFTENNGDSIKTDRTEEDVLFEILLKYGLDLTLPIQEKHVDGCRVYNIGFGAMYICLSDRINISVAVAMGEWHKDSSDTKPSVIFKDSGFNGDDAIKTNTVQTLRQAGIENVKSI
ncbi:site-specific DNA-methyltransferase [Sphingobacterium siyangense]|uniref:site-specific DNA-methyltransferase (adenine-specific) n=1 Tax=Sphingobacterium siyangense TaxID=459529 RepID=A0A562N1Z8_9SPHI|nr:site-specific DNA-methyltransferase [Sphingobacterium siyangense]TWI25871.1 adenine-specific DNA-methyltransferase [Sphingobacterium siyangense]